LIDRLILDVPSEHVEVVAVVEDVAGRIGHVRRLYVVRLDGQVARIVASRGAIRLVHVAMRAPLRGCKLTGGCKVPGSVNDRRRALSVLHGSCPTGTVAIITFSVARHRHRLSFREHFASSSLKIGSLVTLRDQAPADEQWMYDAEIADVKHKLNRVARGDGRKPDFADLVHDRLCVAFGGRSRFSTVTVCSRRRTCSGAGRPKHPEPVKSGETLRVRI
jgi:hypothetical protein